MHAIDALRQVGGRDPGHARVLLMLDFDGTLLPKEARPGDVMAGSELVALLEGLSAIEGVRVAVVSGRSLSDLKQRLPVRNVTLIGSHGGEQSEPSGALFTVDPSRAFLVGVRNAQAELERGIAKHPGCLIERKSQGVALHYRCATDPVRASAANEFVESTRGLVAGGLAQLAWGDQVVELRPLGIDKGDAVSRLLRAESPFAHPVYIGDDYTDEDAFRVLSARGTTIAVGIDRPTHARVRIADPSAVQSLLRHWLDWWSVGGPTLMASTRLGYQRRSSHASGFE